MTHMLRTEDLVSAEELTVELEHADDIVLLDVPSSTRELRVPSAVQVDWRHHLVGPSTSESGATPLPEPQAFRDSIRAWGINHDTPVVVYGDGPLPMAGRVRGSCCAGPGCA